MNAGTSTAHMRRRLETAYLKQRGFCMKGWIEG